MNPQQQQTQAQPKKKMFIRKRSVMARTTAAFLLVTNNNNAGVDAFAPTTRSSRSSTKRFSTIESSPSSASSTSSSSISTDVPGFVTDFFNPQDNPALPCDSVSGIDGANTPPSLNVLMSSLAALRSNDDDNMGVAGPYVDHGGSAGTVLSVSRAVRNYLKEQKDKKAAEESDDSWLKWADNNADVPGAAFTPFASYCLGASFASMVKERQQTQTTRICLANDQSQHAERLADSFSRGAASVDGVIVQYAGVVSDTNDVEDVHEFCRSSGKCDASATVSALNNLNGITFHTSNDGEFTSSDVGRLVEGAVYEVRKWYDYGMLPPSSGYFGVYRTETVNCKGCNDRLTNDVGP